MALVAVLACIISDARADTLDQQEQPDQVAPEEVPFQQEYPRFDWGTVIDVRFAAPDDSVGVLEGGLGKTRYGASPGSDPAAPSGAELIRLSQLSFWMEAHASETLGIFAQANVDAEPDRKQHRGRVDLIEGFAFFRRQLTELFHLDVRGGVIIPPLEGDPILRTGFRHS